MAKTNTPEVDERQLGFFDDPAFAVTLELVAKVEEMGFKDYNKAVAAQLFDKTANQAREVLSEAMAIAAATPSITKSPRELAKIPTRNPFTDTSVSAANNSVANRRINQKTNSLQLLGKLRVVNFSSARKSEDLKTKVVTETPTHPIVGALTERASPFGLMMQAFALGVDNDQKEKAKLSNQGNTDEPVTTIQAEDSDDLKEFDDKATSTSKTTRSLRGRAY